MNNTTNCKCAKRISCAEEALRKKGRANPSLAVAYFGAAIELKKVQREHFTDCGTCQADDRAARERAA